MTRPDSDRKSDRAAPDAVGFVLAGGQSSRMGADKALVPFAGQPLVAHALDVLRQAGLSASLAGARSPLASFAPVVEDSRPDLGPLAGMCAALSSTCVRRAVFLPVDLPLLPVSLVVFLLHRARVTGAAITAPSVGGFVQTFPAVIDRAALPALRAELEAGRRGCFSAFHSAAADLGQSVQVVGVESLVQSGHAAHPDCLPPARWFLNVNCREDIARAEAHLGPSHRVS